MSLKKIKGCEKIKFNMRIFTILSIAMIFILISTASATDADANTTEIASASDNDEIVSVENDLNVISDSKEGTYSDLRKEIKNGGKNIKLTKNNYCYAAGDGDTIEITTSGIIDGKGAVIDMAGSKIRALKVTASGVTIKNLTIKNANYDDGNGGAIYFGSQGKITNCNFVNNTASSRGGAVYFNSNGNVINCNFTNNKATDDSGAVYFNSNGNVTNCNFTNNKATGEYSWGGAISFRGDGNVTNCNFTNNKATGEHSCGGAISFRGDGNVTNCNFTNNYANGEYSRGGAINFETDYYSNDDYKSYTYNVVNCNFSNNSASNGGAINFETDYYSNNDYQSYTCKVVNCNFVDNTGDAAIIGGASVENCSFINNFYGVLSCGADIVNCSFINNLHGAIILSPRYKFEQYYFGSVENCIFINNTATNGGAIFFAEFYNPENYPVYPGSVENCIFINNTATNNGGAIFFGPNRIFDYENPIYFGSAVNCTFMDNTAEEHGGAMYGGSAVNCSFINYNYNYNEGYITEIINCIFSNKIQTNTTENTSDVLINTYSDLRDEIKSGGNITLSKNNYCYVFGDGNPIEITTPCVIDGNGAIIDINRFICAFIVNVSDVTIKNLTIQNSRGGAIKFQNDFNGSVENCIFVNNYADKNGGAMYGGSAENCTFIDNYAITGGAMYAGSAENCNFINNYAITGGAMYAGSAVNSTFINNSALEGGASYDSNTINCTFIDNAAIKRVIEYDTSYDYLPRYHYGYGGAMYAGSAVNSTFINNSADYGGALYNSSAVNSTFRYNIANSYQWTSDGPDDIRKAGGIGGSIAYGSAENCTFRGYDSMNDAAYETKIINCTLEYVHKIIASPAKVTYNSGSYYKIVVYDVDGKLAKNTKVTIKIAGKPFKTLKTNANGVAKFKVTKTPGTYKLTISALDMTVTKTLTVKHLVTLKSATVKKSAKKLILTATLGKINGKYLNKKTVTFKFNGKTYTAKTNKKGIAKITIKSNTLKKLKIGKKITYQATYLKDTVKKTTKVKK